MHYIPCSKLAGLGDSFEHTVEGGVMCVSMTTATRTAQIIDAGDQEVSCSPQLSSLRLPSIYKP